MPEETMDVEKQIECLNAALRLQHRSVLHYSLVAGSVIGLEYQAHAEKMREHSLRAGGRHAARGEDHRAWRRAHDGGGADPFVADPDKAIDTLIDCESETLER